MLSRPKRMLHDCGLELTLVMSRFSHSMLDKHMWWEHMHICRKIHRRGAKVKLLCKTQTPAIRAKPPPVCQKKYYGPLSQKHLQCHPHQTIAEFKKTHHNMAANQKAVLQPLFRYRRWLEGEKQAIPENQSESIANIESHLPPRRGPEASVINYIKQLEHVEVRLMDFYNGNNNRFKKHTFDMRNAIHMEYQAIANSLLGVMGGTIGRPRDDANPVLIGVGLGKFQSTGHLSSLHSTFLSYFISLVSMPLLSLEIVLTLIAVFNIFYSFI